MKNVNMITNDGLFWGNIPVFAQDWEKNTIYLRMANLRGWKWNPVPSEYKPGMLITTPWFLEEIRKYLKLFLESLYHMILREKEN